MNGISVIICTYNGVQRMGKTLEHILQLKADCPWELIIVNNASTDDTVAFCSAILNSHPTQTDWKIVYEPEAGLIHARLKGLEESKYEVVLYCDDDNSLAENYLQVGYEILQSNEKIGALGGCGIPYLEAAKPAWFDKYSHSFAVGPQADKDGKMEDIPTELYGAGTFLRKKPLLYFFDKGFKTIMSGRTGKNLMAGDDVEWCYLVQLAGYEIWYDHRLTFVHYIPASRLQWPYYVKMKKGITAGTGRLLPYTCLLKNRQMKPFSFNWHWLFPTIKSTLIYCKHKMKSLFTSKSIQPEDELAFTILQEKMRSLWLNRRLARQHFRQLKAMI